MRESNQMRELSIEPFDTQAIGSILIKCGGTHVLCTAVLSSDSPGWVEKDSEGNPVHGWVSAEYNMLPASTGGGRKKRGADGRSTEIQRLIGRSLRASVDLHKMAGISIFCDCDVLRADGGTRTVAITGVYVALAQAVESALAQGLITENPIIAPICATSVGVIAGKNHLDLDYVLDSQAEVDMNIVMNADGDYIEVQGTGEKGVFNRTQLNELLDLAQHGCNELLDLQQQALSAWRESQPHGSNT